MLGPKDFQLGQSVITTHKHIRIGAESTDKDWVKVWGNLELSSPLKGIYIGWRKLSNGYVRCDTDWNIWIPEFHFKAALIVINPRQNPILVPFSTLLPYV